MESLHATHHRKPPELGVRTLTPATPCDVIFFSPGQLEDSEGVNQGAPKSLNKPGDPTICVVGGIQLGYQGAQVQGVAMCLWCCWNHLPQVTDIAAGWTFPALTSPLWL